MLTISLPSGEWGKNVVIFCLDNSLSVHADNRKKDLLILGEGTTDGLDDTTITAEPEYSVNTSNNRNKVFSVSAINGSQQFLYLYVVKIHQFK